MSWSKDDLSTYNHAESPWYHIAINGKVDIGNKQGDENKIGLQTWGMFKLVKDWLESNHELRSDEKEELIELLKHS